MNGALPLDRPGPASLVIFGITGDLANRKLLPALYHLEQQGLLPDAFRLFGTTRRELTLETVFDKLRTTLGEAVDEAVLAKLMARTEIVTMDMLRTEEYQRLGERLDAAEDATGVCMTRLFYLSVPAQHFSHMVSELGKSGLQQGCRHSSTARSRLLIEKPFGYDLASAQKLIDDLGQYFEEEQLYRVDHYLAKDTAQNILAFRFMNPLFQTNWRAGYVKTILITAAESIGIEGRADFYEQTGALRDLIQSHLLQLMALVTMEMPGSLQTDEIHAQKLRLLESVVPVRPDEVDQVAVRGQYNGYTDEVNNGESFTETYAALRLYIDNEQWRGVPILLRTGKAMAAKVVEITLVFSDNNPLTHDNTLTIRIQPNEGIVLQIIAKQPGLTNQVTPVQMDFSYERSFGAHKSQPDAYERVLLDAMRGDKMLFATGAEVQASWRIIEAVVQRWTHDGNSLVRYDKESWGPEQADQLAAAVNASWYNNIMSNFNGPTAVGS